MKYPSQISVWPILRGVIELGLLHSQNGLYPTIVILHVNAGGPAAPARTFLLSALSAISFHLSH